MNQNEQPEEFFQKYGFRKTSQIKHPVFKDEMRFEGLEADYVSILEHKVEQLEKYAAMQRDRIEWLMNKEFYKWKDLERKP